MQPLRLDGERLRRVVAPQLGADTLRIDRLSGTGRATLAGDVCQFEKLSVQSDLASVQLDGSLSLASFAGQANAAAVLSAVQNKTSNWLATSIWRSRPAVARHAEGPRSDRDHRRKDYGVARQPAKERPPPVGRAARLQPDRGDE